MPFPIRLPRRNASTLILAAALTGSLAASLTALATGFLTAAPLLAQAGARTGQASAAKPVVDIVPQTPTFRSRTDLVSLDVIVRDSRGQFVPDLKASDFEIYEDGVEQTIESFLLSHGGRTYGQNRGSDVAPQEGLFVPPTRPTGDASGRVFVLFIDDLHIDARLTSKTRDLIGRALRLLIHDGDMFGIVTTGTSSVSQQLTYDRQALESAISRITGNALRPGDILNRGSWGAQGPIDVRHRARVAMETAHDLMKNLERVQNRRKAVIFISSGYDFNPFERTRFEQEVARLRTTAETLTHDPYQIVRESQSSLNEGDLVAELAALTHAAVRANAAIYPIDPRGLVAGQDIDEEVNTQDYQDWVRDNQTTLRVLAEETGGFAVVNQNDFDQGLKRIDTETSDYYLLGFVSSNPDPLKRSRKVEVKVRRAGVTAGHRQGYTLRPLPRAR
jgi:VWFA-related protein